MRKDNLIYRSASDLKGFFKTLDQCYGEILFPMLYIIATIGSFVAAYIANGYYIEDVKSLSFIIGPVIAGVIAFLVGENNRENEIIKLREKWLSEVKQSISRLMSRSESFFRLVLTIAWNTKKPSGPATLTPLDFKSSVKQKEVHDLFSIIVDDKTFLLYTLRNAGGGEVAIKKQIKNVYSKVGLVANQCNIEKMSYKNFKSHRSDFRNRLRNAMASVSDDYFQEEWLRIKKGSLSIRLKRFFCYCIICILMGGYIGVALNNLEIDELKKSNSDVSTNCVVYNLACKEFFIFKE
ncbi:hypothetical protein [Cobetia sp. QF-1]|uniref:hypothetical protein n=1 Tax=Cobetia sp. QF-1 TaxID=1969833 RepID=UPI000B541F26|nr:hypothetical protein [Cobetia sp. QF-1]